MSEPTDLTVNTEIGRRALEALAVIETWYQRNEQATTDEELFSIGRELYHVMRPGLAVLRRARGLPPEHPCTDCGIEEGGAESGMAPGQEHLGEAGRYSICAGCSARRHPDWSNEPTPEEPSLLATLRSLTSDQLDVVLAQVQWQLDRQEAQHQELLLRRGAIVLERTRRAQPSPPNDRVVQFRRQKGQQP